MASYKGSTAFVFGALTIFGDDLNKAVFNRKHIATEKDKSWICQTLGLWLSLYLLGLAVTIMSLRILTGKSTPASGNDPIYMNTINRIITNTIEQSIIFAGLFVPLLFSDDNHVSKIGGNRVLTLAALFVVGRVVYAVGYLLGAMTGISSFRGLGFSIGLIISVLMASYHLGFNLFNVVDTHVAPSLKGFL